MKKISLIGRSHLQKKAFLVLPALFLTQSAMGVVTAHIVEEGTDVRVSFSGSIRVDASVTSDPAPDVVTTSSGTINDDNIFLLADGVFINDMVGIHSVSSLSLGDGFVGEVGTAPFGYNQDFFVWGGTDITGGEVGAVSEITVDPSDSFFVIEDTTLTDVLGATTVDGDTLWTANTTLDTIVLSTSAPVIVPEPSSAILCFFAGIGLLRRKR